MVVLHYVRKAEQQLGGLSEEQCHVRLVVESQSLEQRLGGVDEEQCHVRLVVESRSLEQQLGGVDEEQCHVRLVEELGGVDVSVPLLSLTDLVSVHIAVHNSGSMLSTKLLISRSFRGSKEVCLY